MSLGQEYDYLFKVLIIGNSCVGKSNILLRFSDNLFHESFLPTIGVDFKIRNVECKNKTIKLHIWDTAGQERFKTITATYYKGAHGIILVYDITDRISFQEIENWLSEIEHHASAKVTKILVGNKSDLEDQRQVSYQEGKDFADKLGMEFLETSAKSRINIDETFMKLTNAILPTVPSNNKPSDNGISGLEGRRKKPVGEKKKGCC